MRSPRSECRSHQLNDRKSVANASLAGEIFPLIYDELRSIAAGMLRGQSSRGSIQPTVLVHEAYLRVQPRLADTFGSEEQFKSFVARAMRSVLIDHARRESRIKRGGNRRRLTLIDQPADLASVIDILAIDEALTRLAALSKRKERLVECRCFAGMSVEESAAALGISRSTAANDWAFARAWLARELRDESAES